MDEALAAEQLSLSDEQIVRLEAPYVPHAVSGIELDRGNLRAGASPGGPQV